MKNFDIDNCLIKNNTQIIPLKFKIQSNQLIFSWFDYIKAERKGFEHLQNLIIYKYK